MQHYLPHCPPPLAHSPSLSSQLFTIGHYLLNPDGTEILDPETGSTIETYSSHDIMAAARVWTGLVPAPFRPGLQIDKERNGRGNYVDPMVIDMEIRDRLPKTQIGGGYVGDGYPLCSELPDQAFLLRGTEWRLVDETSAVGGAGYHSGNAGIRGGRAPCSCRNEEGSYTTEKQDHKQGPQNAMKELCDSDAKCRILSTTQLNDNDWNSHW